MITCLLDYISDPTGLADFNIQGDSGGFSRASAPLKPASAPRVPIIALCDVHLSKCAFIITPGFPPVLPDIYKVITARKKISCIVIGNAHPPSIGNTHTHTHLCGVVVGAVVVMVMQTAGHIMRNMRGFLLQ